MDKWSCFSNTFQANKVINKCIKNQIVMGKVVKEHKGTQGNNKESLFYDYLVMVFQSLIGITNN